MLLVKIKQNLCIYIYIYFYTIVIWTKFWIFNVKTILQNYKNQTSTPCGQFWIFLMFFFSTHMGRSFNCEDHFHFHIFIHISWTGLFTCIDQ